MVTMEQAKNGVRTYIDREIADKVPGLKKWMIAIAAEPIVMEIENMMHQYKDALVHSGYMMEDGMINDDKFFQELTNVARQKGSVVEHMPLLGDVTFSENDIHMLHNYVG